MLTHDLNTDTFSPVIGYCPESFVVYTEPEDVVRQGTVPSVNVSWSQPLATDNVDFAWDANTPRQYVIMHI